MKLDVHFAEKLEIKAHQKTLISELLSLKPIPRYQNKVHKIYRMQIENFDVEFQFEKNNILVTKITLLS